MRVARLLIGSLYLVGTVPADEKREIQPFAVTLPYRQAAVQSLTATPATITFSATDPDLSPVAGPQATVTWSVDSGSNAKTWNITVSGSAASFTNCGSVPVSAVTVSCASASVSAGGGSGVCNAPFTLSTAAQQVASGFQGNGNNRTYTVRINYTFADSWQYRAAQAPPCTLNLTYVVFVTD